MENLAQEPLDPIFASEFTDGQRADIAKAHRWAYKAILLAVEGFRSAPPGSDHWNTYSGYMDWTPADRVEWRERKAIVEGIFLKMAQLMCRKSIRYHKLSNCTGDVLGNTVLGGEGPVNLCDGVFNDDRLRLGYFARADWVRALAVIHEISHAVVGGTKDIDNAYEYLECRNLAARQPAKAVQNAQNYAYFAMFNALSSPDAEHPHPGIWEQKRVGGAGPACAGGPAAAIIAEDTLMLAYAEPEPPKPSPEAMDVGGLLHFKTLDMHEGRAVWSDATPMKAGKEHEQEKTKEIRSSSAPALAVVNQRVYCACIDPYTSRLLVVNAVTHRSSSEGSGLSRYVPGDRSDLKWSPLLGIAGNVDARFGPAMVGFNGGDSSGLYVVYVERTGSLKCLALLWGEGFFRLEKLPSGYTPIPFDGDRKSISAPALIVLNGELKCVYRDATKGWVSLAYEPAPHTYGRTDVKPGTWHPDRSTMFQFETESLALALWNTKAGPCLVAIGRGKGDDRTLHYAISPPVSAPGEGRWLLGVQSRAYRTSFPPTLLSHGAGLHSFHRLDDGGICWLSATA
jgi:hypothetical protein